MHVGIKVNSPEWKRTQEYFTGTTTITITQFRWSNADEYG